MRLLTLLLCCWVIAASEAPIVNAAYIHQHWDEVSDADLELIRSQKILFASRSFGLNLMKGLGILAKEDKRYDVRQGYQRWDVFKKGGDLSIIPGDAFDQYRFVHFLATYWPHGKRLQEMDTLLRDETHAFAGKCDVVMIYFHYAAGVFEPYCKTVDAIRKDFPKLTVVIVTSGFMGPSKAKDNAKSRAFSDQIRARYGGKLPIYDLGAILSADHRDGDFFVKEHTKDPADVHPSSDLGQAMMAKGFILALRESLRHRGGDELASVTGAGQKAETLAVDHPEYLAVRAILDANQLPDKKVENVAVVEDGHVVELYLQEGGVVRIGDEIGQLPALRLLHCYGDKSLDHPLLREVSGAIGRCRKLREILFTDNELDSLPSQISQLDPEKLSLAGNPLSQVDGKLKRWIERHDPSALTTGK